MELTVIVITALPKTRQGHTAILVFVERLSKMVHLVSTVTHCTAADRACTGTVPECCVQASWGASGACVGS